MSVAATIPVLALAAAIAAAPLAALAQPAGQTAAPPAYARLPETSRFIDGPGADLAQRRCLACHSADYVATQPRGMPESFWANEVAKMRSAYGAPMSDDDAKAVANYLSANYGAEAPARR